MGFTRRTVLPKALLLSPWAPCHQIPTFWALGRWTSSLVDSPELLLVKEQGRASRPLPCATAQMDQSYLHLTSFQHEGRPSWISLLGGIFKKGTCLSSFACQPSWKPREMEGVVR
jgi:hypothetical protein